MSPALKSQQPATSLPGATGILNVRAHLPKLGNFAREQQTLIERSYSDAEPDVPSLPGAVTVAILVSASAASWFAVIALVRVVVS